MHRKHWLTVCSMLVIVTMVLGACGATAQPTATKAPQATTAPQAPTAPKATAAAATPVPAGPKKGGTLIFLGHQEVSGMSPDDVGPTVHRVIIANIHNALLELNYNFELEPTLAESYTAAPDGLMYTFKLRKDVKFHNGKAFTSKDVKYTYDFYRDPANAAAIASYFEGIDTVEAPDDYTIVIKMKTTNAAFLANAPVCYIVESEYHAQVGQDQYRTAPIGTGPFKLKEWKPAEYVLLEAFDGYFKGRPNVDFLREDIVPEPSVRTIAMQTGKAHFTAWPPLVDDCLKFDADPNFKVYRAPSTSVNRFSLNNKVPALADKVVRQAMMYAIDRQQVINDVFKGAAVVADQYLSPSYVAWQKPDVKKYEYNPEKAKQLLDNAGYKPGPDGIRVKGNVRLSFTCTTITGDQARKPEAEYVQQFLKKVGIEMVLVEAPVASILEGLLKGTMEASLFNWDLNQENGDPDPQAQLGCGGGTNFMQYCNPELDKLITAGITEVDPAKRKVIYNQIHDIFVDEVPCIYMMYWEWFTIVSGKLKGLPDWFGSSDFLFRDAYKWWLED